jgi:hypothetical protein
MRSKRLTYQTVKKIIFLILTFLFVKTAYTQIPGTSNEIFGLGYSIETSRILNNRMFIEGNYTLGRRTFEVGLTPGSYNTDGQGFLFKHKIFLNKKKGNNRQFSLKNHKLRTFAVYKFVMFSSTTKTLRQEYKIREPESVFQNTLTSPTINTIEHYLGLGMEVNIYNDLFVEVIGVGGINFLKNNSQAIIIEEKVLPKVDLDISWDISLGINYRF